MDTNPLATRIVPATDAGEAAMLSAYLDYQRHTFRWKTQGLSRAQLAVNHPPSTLTLGGLVLHLAMIEDWWFGVVLRGVEHIAPFAAVDFVATPDWEFETAAEWDTDELYGIYESVVVTSEAAVEAALAGSPGLSTVAANRTAPAGQNDMTLRWILLHMIEEYARHNGHADLIREAIDGLTGM